MNTIYRLLLNLLICSLIECSRICSIYRSLNCSCYQSDNDLLNNSPIKIYSHLYCQGKSLNEKTFQSPFGSDFYQQNRFRTISLEFFLNDEQVEIDRNQFNSLALLTSQSESNVQIEISIRLNGFRQIIFKEESINSQMFHHKHHKKHFSLHLTPTTLHHIQKEGDEDWNAIDQQFDISPNSFTGLIVSQMNLYIHTYKDYFPLKYSFEEIFNNTNIGELHFYGSIIPPGSILIRKSFKGLIRSLTLHRHVDTIDSDNFPYYNSVNSYNIHSIEAHSMDLQSFIPLYTNLRGLTLIKPRFEVSIDQLIPSLDSLTLDIEFLNEQTIYSAKHINYLKLTSRLRRIDPQVLNSLINRLKTFDLSEIDLTSITPESQCYLIHFIRHAYQRHSIHLILPRLTSLTECHCPKILLQYLQFHEQFRENSLCSKQCRFSDCPTISLFFREKYPLFNEEDPPLNNRQYSNEFDLVDDQIDLHLIHFLNNQTQQQQQPRVSSVTWSKITKKFIERTTTTTIIPLVMTTTLSSVNEYELYPKEEIELNKSKSSPWIPILLGIILVSTLIFLFLIIFLIRYKSRQHSKFVRVES